jgi:hypothetical protein
MYNKGDLKITDLPCAQMDDDGDCDDVHCHKAADARGGSPIPHPCAFLPHSCQEWAIGGPEQIRAMIEDLTEALKAIEGAR